MDNNTTHLFDSWSRKEVTISWDGDEITSVRLGGREVINGYLPEGRLLVGHLWEGVIYPLTKKEVEDFTLTGGSLHFWGDDLYNWSVVPPWWGVEAEMAMEVTPPWPLAEDDIGGEEIGFPISALMAIFSPPPPEEEEDEGGDFV